MYAIGSHATSLFHPWLAISSHLFPCPVPLHNHRPTHPPTHLARSWNIPRAVKYREINKVTGLKGTAVNVQTMVYGNINDNSGTGVLFTRNPATGVDELFGEFLINAQGEDVVAGEWVGVGRCVCGGGGEQHRRVILLAVQGGWGGR